MTRRRIRVAVAVVSGLFAASMESLAFNAASNQERWPGALDLVRSHPWATLVAVAPLMAWGLFPRDPAPADTAGGARTRLPQTFHLPPRNLTFAGRESFLLRMRTALTANQ